MKTKKELMDRLDALDYPWEQFTVDHFINYIGRVIRKRRIEVTPIPHLHLPWCASGPTIDYIFYSSTLSHAIQNHHKLHEVGHFILGHTQSIRFIESENVIEVVGRFYGHFRSAAPVDDVLTTDEENEAEYFVYLIHQQLHNYKRLHELTSIAHRKNLFIPPFTGEFSKFEE